MFARLLSLIIWVACLSFPSQALSALFEQQTPAFVTVNQAFGFDFNQQGHQLTLSWTLKPGYYLYRHKITISSQHASLASWQLPPGKPHKDEFFGQTEIYPHNLSLPLTLRQAGPDAMLTVTYQGCAAAGFCYPPETRTVPLSATEPARPSPSAEALPLPFSPLWALLIGIGVAFTPCVLPMYPMISGIILGGRRTLSSGRILSLAFLYIQGMAVTYTLMGVVVAAAGLRFQAALQSPVLLILLAVIFILLALPMFGLFNLQLPSSVQTRLTLWSNQQQGGSLAGVFVMGILAGLICSPCTTAPLSAILLYIAQSGNLLAGAATLYIYAIGMGLPLIAVTLFGSQLLPRSGPWMQTVKEGFGFVILTLPVFFIERVIGDTWGLRLWSLLGVAAAGWAFLLAGRSASGWGRWLALVWLVLAMLAARPLQDWAFPATRPQTTPAVLSFVPVQTAEQLREKLQQTTHKITLVDLYADWCVACKEFEKYTFTDPQVKAGLAGMQRLQADVTANSAADHQLLSDLKVLGLPTLLFFDPHGQEIPGSRISGYLNPRQFIAHVQRVRQSQPD